MPRLRKDVLKPATYSVPDRSGKQRHSIEFTDADISHLLTRYQEMTAAGLHVPVSWNHQDDAKPKADRLADRARHVIGWAEGADIEGKTLAFNLDIPDDADAKQAKTTRYVSPEMVTDWVDGMGRMWPGRSITHIAVTAMPVNPDQKPFEQLSIIRLSLADVEPDPMPTDIQPMLAYLAKRKIVFPKGTTADNLLPRLNTIRMALDEEAGEESETPEAAPPAEGEAPAAPPADDGKAAMMKKAVQYLQGQGIHLPDDTTDKNFVERLCVACHALENSQGADDVETPNPNAAPQDQPKPAPADPGIMMSLDREKKRADRAEALLLKSEKASLGQRIQRLKVSKPIRDKLLAGLKTERLSLQEDGSLSMSELVTTVKAYEALDPESINPVLLSVDRGSETPTPVPDPEVTAATKASDHAKYKLSGGRLGALMNGQGVEN